MCRAGGVRAGSGRQVDLEGLSVCCCWYHGGIHLLDGRHIRGRDSHAGETHSQMKWFYLRYSILKNPSDSVSQVVGHKEGLDVMERADPLFLLIGLPTIPVMLILGKMIRWEDYVLRLWRKYSTKLQILNSIFPGQWWPDKSVCVVCLGCIYLIKNTVKKLYFLLLQIITVFVYIYSCDQSSISSIIPPVFRNHDPQKSF